MYANSNNKRDAVRVPPLERPTTMREMSENWVSDD